MSSSKPNFLEPPEESCSTETAVWTAKRRQKFSKSALKWLRRLFAHCKLENEIRDDDGSPLSGFFILNAGCLGSNACYEVRQLLISTGAVELDSPDSLFLRYSSHLPFILAEVPLQCSSLPSIDIQCESQRFTLFVVTIPDEIRAASHHPSSSNLVGEVLFLLRCSLKAVQPLVEHLFQRRVIRVQSSPMPSDSPRVIRSHLVPEIPGLFVIPDFLTEAEHDDILSFLDRRSDLTLQYLSRRRVAHFNRRFIYGVNKVGQLDEDVNPNPPFFSQLQMRLHNLDSAVKFEGELPPLSDRLCDQLTVNYYDYSAAQASGIAPHVDAHSPFLDNIFIVSVGSYTVMEFRRWDEKSAYPVFVEPRSLVVMNGEVRYGWEHTIVEKRSDVISELVPCFFRTDRVSLTWRVARDATHHKADCLWPALCDGV